MPRDYDDYFVCPDDTVCCECGAKLMANAEEEDTDYHGYCDALCMNRAMTRLHKVLDDEKHKTSILRGKIAEFEFEIRRYRHDHGQFPYKELSALLDT